MMAGFNGNFYNNGVGNNYGGMQNGGVYYAPPTPAPNNIQALLQPVYVHGLEGANAYQLPMGVMRQILWDDEQPRFYIKALDEFGRPRVVADNDFQPHVEPTKEEPHTQNGEQIDFSVYPTKKDLEDFLSKFDTSTYVTRSYLDQALSELTLGTQGRIVRNESNS